MKKIFLLIMSVLLATTGFADITSSLFQNSFNSDVNSPPPTPRTNSNKKQFLNKTVAIVNNKPITAIELDREVAKLQAMNPNPQFDQDDLAIKRQALQELISQQVLLQLAGQNNINVSEQQVDAAIKDIASKNNISVDSLQLNIEASGMSLNSYKKQIHDQIMVSQLQQQAIAQQVYVSPEEIQKYIKKHATEFNRQMTPIKIYTLRNLIITLPKSRKARRTKIDLYKKLAIAVNKGLISFKETAEQFSQAPNASNGGLVSHPLKFEAIPTMYQDEVKRLKEHQVSKPFLKDGSLQMIYIDHLETDAPLMTKKITKYFVYAIAIKLDSSMKDDGAKNALDRAKLAIESGQKFTKIAEKINQDYDHANGKFGWVSTMDSPPSLPIAAFARLQSLAKDKLSEPFQADAKTWMIVKYTKTKIYDAAEELKEQKALEAIYSEKAQQLYKTWVASMKDSAYINVLEPDLKTPELY